MAIKYGNYASCPGLTYKNDTKFYLYANKTIKGHFKLVYQGVRSTFPKKATHTMNALPTTLIRLYLSHPNIFISGKDTLERYTRMTLAASLSVISVEINTP